METNRSQNNNNLWLRPCRQRPSFHCRLHNIWKRMLAGCPMLTLYVWILSSRWQASQPYETVPIGTILSPSEGGRNPQGKPSDIGCEGWKSRTQAIALRGKCVTTVPPSHKPPTMAMQHLRDACGRTVFSPPIEIGGPHSISIMYQKTMGLFVGIFGRRLYTSDTRGYMCIWVIQ